MNDHAREEHVQPLPLQAAEARLRHTRTYLRVVEPLIKAELAGQDRRLSDLLHEVLGGHGPHPRYGDFGASAALLAKERLEEAEEQLPRVLFNSLLAYAVSMIEAMLAECVEEAEAITKRRATGSKGHSSYLDRMAQLKGLGVRVTLSAELESELNRARLLRNEVVHETVAVSGADVSSALGAAEGLLGGLRAGLLVVEGREDDFVMRRDRLGRDNHERASGLVDWQ